MKYSGSITINDDEGNIVYERELDADAIIEMLLTQPAAPVEETKYEKADLFPTRRNKGKEEKRPAGKGKPCCGSAGTRHKKGCPSAGSRAGVVETFNEVEDEVSGGGGNSAETHSGRGWRAAFVKGRGAHGGTI